MSQQDWGDTNKHVRSVYEELGELLEQGDDVFVARFGPPQAVQRNVPARRTAKKSEDRFMNA